MVQCKYCGDILDHPLLVGMTDNKIKTGTSGVTTGLSRHYKVCKKGPKHLENVRNGMNKYSMKKRQTIIKDVILNKTLDFFISGNIAFNQADNPHFQALMAEIQVDGAAVVINRHNVRQRLSTQATQSREDLMSTLMSNQSRISLALDCWTSRNNMAFLGISPSLVTYNEH